MIKKLDNGKVLVAHVTIDDKNAKKEYIEDVIGSCLAPLNYYITPLISNLNCQKTIRYNGFISIDKFINYVKESVEKKFNHNVELEINYPDGNSAIELFVSCDSVVYNNSTYASKEFMMNVRGFEKMIINVEVDKINKENYYWFTHPKMKCEMY
ncbi:hypothetical protein ACFC4S_23200 [Priestia megaterium]|uniref:hypothetical protein n=1 Tax=Priestia megaterium TaxID=1404 RepID=UPI0035DF821B